ncbi:MAG: amidophosphoribosyltransferase [Bacillota bacterium]
MGIREECGVFGVFGHAEAAHLTYYGLYALQHRGQESAGIAVSDGRGIVCHKGMGLVSEVFNRERIERLPGTSAIGHVRYSTTGRSYLVNAQPLCVTVRGTHLALAHNGNLVNAAAIRESLESMGSIFQTSLDTEVVAHLVAHRQSNGIEPAIMKSLNEVKGAYAFLFMTPDRIFAARDPHGIRPLSMGKLGDAVVFSSETCAFDIIGAETVRDVRPGEMIVVDSDGYRSVYFDRPAHSALCIFEYIYFARPDSNIEGVNVHAARKQMGKILAEEHPADADLVTGVPDSSISAATGFAEESGIPYEMGLVKNKYIGRTFIQPSEEQRSFGVKVKLNALGKVVRGKRVVLVDDSIVRGTTIGHIVNLLQDAGAREVHLRVASPPYRFPCFYGIDTSTSGELIAASKTPEEIARIVRADSLGYLSIRGLARALGRSEESFCLSCFSGRYPVEIPPGAGKFILEGGARCGE